MVNRKFHGLFSVPARQQYRQWLLLFAVSLFALAARGLFFNMESRDYQVFLKPWFNELAANGGFRAISRPIGDYSPTYIYILAALTYLPIDSLLSIKLVSFVGDMVMAVYAMRLASRRSKNNKLLIAVYATVMAMPTVLLNSGAWGQCDSIYTAALIACVYYMVAEKPDKGMLAFGVAFAFKLQAVFLAPMIWVLFLRQKIKFHQLLYAPLIYLTAVLPAAFAGRNMADLLTIYIRQAGSYSALSLGAPNFYAFLEVENTLPFTIIGILAFAATMLFITIYAVRHRLNFSANAIIQMAMLSLILTPFMLPHMHERYFYAADVFSVVYAVQMRKRWFIPLLISGSSLYVYCRYLFGLGFLPVGVATIPMFAALCIVAADYTITTRNWLGEIEKQI